MLRIEIPGRGTLSLEHAVFDVNGTLAVDGRLVEGVAERLSDLGQQLTIHLLTADTHGGQAEIDRALGLSAHRLTPGGEREQKATFVRELGASSVVAIGNGSNDAGMLEAAALGIAVMGGEGLSAEAAVSATILVGGIIDGLELLLRPKRLAATLRR